MAARYVSKAAKAERAEAIARLLEYVKPGDTLFTILRHMTRSGMGRVVQVIKFPRAGEGGGARTLPYFLGYNIALATGIFSYDRNKEGVRVPGVGTDAGFWLVYTLGQSLWPDGYECPGAGVCHSDEHANGQRKYGGGVHHTDGGYALHQQWL